MKKIKTSFLSLFLLFFALFSNSKAQTYKHATMWSRLSVSKQIKEKWLVSGEFLYRRQNNYINSSLNFLEKPLLETTRFTVGYRYKKWQFSFSPSRWHAYQLLGKEADFSKTPTIEWRFTPGTEFSHKFKKGSFQWRNQYEFRNFVDQDRGRLRQRFQYRYPINKTNDFMIGNEFLFGAPPNSSKRFEQNQFNLLWLPKFSKHLDAELGYRNIYRKRRNSEEIDTENALVASLFVRL